ncbi:hypothetical protein AK812_SmicGene25185 [Symbiodinium microadriaticum]|uniref:Uncharacterized protein n=1 Tax=Symbiodinium microadriaticum TaxID=2951 RepID=A0A1Q9DCQ3_SYMMI|nr:hypothetical protein AK812_SmicGene25185 [Symbiodinium microadriaticum]
MEFPTTRARKRRFPGKGCCGNSVSSGRALRQGGVPAETWPKRPQKLQSSTPKAPPGLPEALAQTRAQDLTVNPKCLPVVAKRPSDKALDQSCRAKCSNLEGMGMRIIVMAAMADDDDDDDDDAVVGDDDYDNDGDDDDDGDDDGDGDGDGNRYGDGDSDGDGDGDDRDEDCHHH